MKISTTLSAAAVLLACAGASVAQAEIAYAVTDQQRLISFDTNNPNTLLTSVAVTGLAINDRIGGIDFRPSNGLLYGLGTSANNLYTLNPATGAVTSTVTLSTALSGGNFGFDFNPTGPVALRITSNTANNYRIPDPATGVVITDAALNYVAGDPNFGVSANVTHVAYTNSVPGATSTTLFGIDAGTDTLVRFVSPNAGTLQTVGTLGMGTNVNINVIGGFDISGATGNAFAATQNVLLSQSTLWGINLATGAGVNLGSIGGGETLVAFTLLPNSIPTPGALTLLGLSGLVVARRRRVG